MNLYDPLGHSEYRAMQSAREFQIACQQAADEGAKPHKLMDGGPDTLNAGGAVVCAQTARAVMVVSPCDVRLGNVPSCHRGSGSIPDAIGIHSTKGNQ